MTDSGQTQGWFVFTILNGDSKPMSSNFFGKGLKRSALTVALGMCFAAGVSAQSTSGAIFGKAGPGPTITIVGE